VSKCGWPGYSVDLMMETLEKGKRRFEAHGGARLHALNGVPLAAYWQRALGYFIDLIIAIVIWFPIEVLWRRYVLHEHKIEVKWDFHEAGNLLVMVLYWGVANYLGNGKSPGKWVARTRAVSLVSERLGPWQSVERVLGYGAALLEAGLGFLQIFWDSNRMCAQDRLAETIVVDTRKSAK
jgi:uncharacterized RDD family membrane protein YckC